jgi:hypothetical protein
MRSGLSAAGKILGESRCLVVDRRLWHERCEFLPLYEDSWSAKGSYLPLMKRIDSGTFALKVAVEPGSAVVELMQLVVTRTIDDPRRSIRRDPCHWIVNERECATN